VNQCERSPEPLWQPPLPLPPLLRGEGEGRIPGTPYPGLHSFVVHPGLQSYHPYGISVWCEEGTEAGEEKVEGL
jgi:hypothetical protein